MNSVRRQRCFVRLSFGVVQLTEAALGLNKLQDSNEMYHAEYSLRTVLSEFKKMPSSDDDYEVSGRLHAVQDFFAALSGKQLAIEDKQATWKVSYVLATKTGPQALAERLFELWHGENDFASLNSFVEQSTGHDPGFSRVTFEKTVSENRDSAAHVKFVQAEARQQSSDSVDPSGEKATCEVTAHHEVTFLAEVSGFEVCWWSFDAITKTFAPCHDARSADQVVHLCRVGGTLYVMKLMEVADFLARLKQGTYSGLTFGASLLKHLQLCAHACQEKRLTENTETLMKWMGRELQWLYCLGLCMRSSEDDLDSASIFRLFHLLAVQKQHDCILNDFLHGLFPLKFGTEARIQMQLWEVYARVCLGQIPQAVTALNCVNLDLGMSSEQRDWSNRLQNACDFRKGDLQALPVTLPPASFEQSSWTFSGKRSDIRKQHVLSIDGGGIRGILPAMILAEVERHIPQQPLCQLFPVMAGTSTGSIISAGLAMPGIANSPKFTASEIVHHFKHANIFRNKHTVPLKCLYDPALLCNLLEEVCGSVLFKDLLSEVVIPTVQDGQTERHVFSRRNAIDVHSGLKVYDVVRASSAAPAYFPEHTFRFDGTESTFFDGGLKCNNPAQLAMDAAEQMFPNDHLTLLSLGTGFCSLHPKSQHGALWWGLSTAAAGTMADLCCTADDVHRQMLRRSYGNRKLTYLRQNVALSRRIDLADDTQQSIAHLVDLGQGFIEEAYASDDNWFNKLMESLMESADHAVL